MGAILKRVIPECYFFVTGQQLRWLFRQQCVSFLAYRQSCLFSRTNK